MVPISIVMPVYNAGSYLSVCLESILHQSYRDYELILVDDGSTDHSGEVCDNYQAKDARITVIHQKNKGQVSAQKTGCRAAAGRYILCADADDFMEDGFLENLAMAARQNQAEIIACGYKSTDSEGRLQHEVRNHCKSGLYTGAKLSSVRNKILYDASRKGMNTGALIFSPWTKLVKKELFCSCLDICSPYVVQGEDVLMLLLMLQRCSSLQVIDETGYCYRENQTSVMHQTTFTDVKRQKVLMKELLRHRSDKEGNDYSSQIYVYLFYRTLDIIFKYCSGRQYRDYMILIRLIGRNGLFRYADMTKIQKPSWKNRIALWAVQNRKWKLLYFIHKVNAARLRCGEAL